MSLFKKIVFPALSVLMIYLSVQIINGLVHSDSNEFGFAESAVVAFLLSLYITGIFAFTGFAYSTHKLLPKEYYKIHHPKRLNLTYKLLGLKYFKYILLLFFWGSKKNRNKYFDGTRQGLKNFVYQTKQSEFGHFAALVVLFIFSVILLIKGYNLLVLLITILNFIGNLLPVILQRQHRIRIGRIADHL